MAETPPKKKLRLILRSKAKVENLLSRRRQARNESSSDAPESDFEDDEPILSRIITGPSNQSSKQGVRLKIVVPTTQHSNSTSSRSDSTNCTQGASQDEVEAHEKAIKAQRRMGMVPSQNGTFAFHSQNIISHGKAIMRDPADGVDRHEFSFNAPMSAKSDIALGTPKTAYARNSETHVGLEGNKVSITRTRANPLSSLLFSKESSPISSPAKRQIPSPGPLDHLKLASTQPQAPKLDQATDIVNITDYLHPRIPFPEVRDKLYRNSALRPELSSKTFRGTLPDWKEVAHFVKDVEGDTAPELTENGDLPALSKPQRVRVPVGARLGKMSNGQSHPDDGDTVMTDASPIRLPLHVQNKVKKVVVAEAADNAYTSSQIVLDAYETVKIARKRKRQMDPASMPSPDYIFQHTGRKDFNIFQNGFLMLPELCLLLAANLPVQTLIDLYSISKDFHIIVNQRFTTIILNQVSLKAPNAARCYPWRCFKHLSQPDPALAAQTVSLAANITTADTNHGNTSGAQINIKPSPAPPVTVLLTKNPYLHRHTRRVPTFRWLQLAIHREKVVHALYQTFAARGVPLPGDPAHSRPGSFCNSLHKLWFMFDIPDNPRRIQYIHTQSLISDNDLANIMTFVVKLDMICNDPLAPEKRDGLRKLLMSSCDGFDTILRVIRRERWKDELSLLRAWTRFGFQLDREDGRERLNGGFWVPLGLSPAEHKASRSVFGIPKNQVGILKREFWGELEYDREKRTKKPLIPGVKKQDPRYGRGPANLIRPEQLVLREMVRRGYTFEKSFLDAILIGYVDRETNEDLPPRDLNGGRSRILEDEGEYDVDDAVAGLRALTVAEGGDELLDLGSTDQGSSSTVAHHGPRASELRRRKEEKETLDGYMAAWKQEVEAEKLQRVQMAYRVVD